MSYEDSNLRTVVRGGYLEVFLAPFFAQWSRGAKNHIFLQTIDRYTYEKKLKSKSQSETEVSSHLRKNIRKLLISRKFLIFPLMATTINSENWLKLDQDHGKSKYFS